MSVAVTNADPATYDLLVDGRWRLAEYFETKSIHIRLGRR
jgi:hypothetical protein